MLVKQEFQIPRNMHTKSPTLGIFTRLSLLHRYIV